MRELVLDRWRDKSREAGHDPDSHRIGIIRGVFVTDDPEREWPPLREAERYRMRVYGRFVEEAGQGGKQVFLTEGRISQNIIIGDVDTCVAELTDFIVEHGFTDVVTWGSSPALPPEVLTPAHGALRRRGRAARASGRRRRVRSLSRSSRASAAAACQRTVEDHRHRLVGDDDALLPRFGSYHSAVQLRAPNSSIRDTNRSVPGRSWPASAAALMRSFQ